LVITPLTAVEELTLLTAGDDVDDDETEKMEGEEELDAAEKFDGADELDIAEEFDDEDVCIEELNDDAAVDDDDANTPFTHDHIPEPTTTPLTDRRPHPTPFVP